ncbi:MAG: hybrid sensor histidine kinase/response regulator [Proteobacteria bacterium]|nr:hybrid sensor histidine kinase/response regulator [Pseudomonadota bacterium]
MDVRTKQATLLIVDDNPHNIQLLKAILSLRGYQLIIAKNGVQALESVKAVLPDLIILDIMMPEMDGFEACQRLKENPATRTIPIIFLTAKSHIDDIMKGFELGAVDYITKPFSTNELMARVEIQLKLKFSQDTVIKQRNELSEMVQILCHDLANPLGAVMSSFELAEYDPDYLNQNKNLILSYIKKQYEIIGMVRDLRAVAENRSTFNLKTVNLNKAFCDSLETLHFKFLEKKIRPELSIDGQIHIIAEKVSLVNSVLNNLLTNAIKFSYPESTISISAYKNGALAVVCIKDNGIGIPENVMDKLFDIDRRAIRFGTMSEKGTGFGMPLVKKFISEYGASMDVVSKDEALHPDDHGTTITLHFKLA